MTQQPPPAPAGEPASSADHPQQAPSTKVSRQLRTRRKLWLGAHPEYSARTSHALALPLAYDRLIRTYQTPAERQEEGRRQGWARTLEGALVRGEAKRDAAVRQREWRESSPEVKSADSSKGTERMGSGSRDQWDSGTGLRPLPEEISGNGNDGESEDISPARAGDRSRFTIRSKLGDKERYSDSTGIKQEAQGSSVGREDSSEGQVVVQDKVSEVDDAAVDAQWDIPLGIVSADELFSSQDGDSEVRSSTSDPEVSPNTSGESSTAHSRRDGHLNKDTARLRWEALLAARFIAGADGDFDYEAADYDDTLEIGWRDSRREEAWFEDESEEWASDVINDGEQPLMQTGIQDF